MAIEIFNLPPSKNGSYGEDSPDGSSIKVVPFLESCSRYRFDSADDVIFSILSPPKTTKEGIQAPPILHEVFLGTRGKTCSDATAKAAINWLIEPAANHGGISAVSETESVVVLGFDTETGAQGGASLIQLCTFGGPGKAGRILVAHKKSGIFPNLGVFLAGQADWLDPAFSRTRFICAAAEATGDVLLLLTDTNIRMAAVLDLNDCNADAKAGRTPGLRRMLNEATNAHWIKDKEVTCSDWDALPLTLEQLKYASLDAWGSEILGRIATLTPTFKKAYASQDAPDGFLSGLPLFSSIQFPRALAFDFIATLNEAQSYQDAGKAKFAVDFDRFIIDEKNLRVTRVHLTSFSKRLRSPPFQSPVEARITTTRKNVAGATRVLIGKVESVVGRLAKIRWSQSDAADIRAAFEARNLTLETDNFSDVDQSIQKAIAALVKVVKAFKIAPLANVNLSSIQCSSGREAMERLEELPRPVQTLLQSSAIVLGLSLLFGATGGIQKPVEPLNSPSEFKLLNASQKAAVKLGLEKQISLVRGPPGTGKTSTIAAFAGAVTAGGGRVLIIAPANAATLRALESIVAQDLRSVALVASQEWMLEWHQDSVHAHLQPFVVTPEVLDVRKQKARQRIANSKLSSDRKSDLNDRAVIKPKSKWDSALESFREEKLPSSAIDIPSIMIMTHGSFISLNAEDKTKRKNALRKLVSTSTVDAVVVDECSQLWKGHTPALFDAFRASTHFVLVGDDRQLPPFGSDAVADLKKASSKDKVTSATHSKSLFDAGRGCSPMVPLTQLNKSYRLTRPVGEILSPSFYGNELEVVRNPERDSRIRERVRKGFEILAQHRHNKDNTIARAVIDASLVGPKATGFIWIHVAGSVTKVRKSSANEAEANIVSQIVPELLCALRKSEQAEGITDGYGSSAAAAWVGYGDQEEDFEDTSSEQESSCSTEDTSQQTHESDFTSNHSLGRGAEEDLQAGLVEEAVAHSREHLEASKSGQGQRSRLCVITPYEAQRARIEKGICDKLQQSHYAEDSVDLGDDMSTWVRASRTVGNVDALQGQEADVCIVSAVRAPALGNRTGYGLGFLNDNRRTNVMLSRAQQLLVIVGDAEGWFQGPPGSMLRAFAAKSLEDGTCFGIRGSLGQSKRVSLLKERHALERPFSLVRLEVANHGPVTSIWKSPLPDFVVPETPRQKDRVPPKAAPKQSKRPSNAAAAAEVSASGGGGHKTFNGSLVREPPLSSRQQKKTGRGKAAASANSSRDTTSASSGFREPTREALLAAMVDLSRSSPKHAVPGVVLMKRFPRGTWITIKQASKAFTSAGLRVTWRHSKFYVGLLK